MSKFDHQLVLACCCCITLCAPAPEEQDPEVTLNYVSIADPARNASQHDMSGEGGEDGTVRIVTTTLADGLWGDFEEIGFYYTSLTEFDFSLSAVFDSLAGTDVLRQGGIMIRSGLHCGAEYAAIRLTTVNSDFVTRKKSTARANSHGETPLFRKGDLMSITCNETNRSDSIRTIEVDMEVTRGTEIVSSLTDTLTVTSGKLYAGVFAADHSQSNGSFSVSRLRIVEF